MLPTQPTMAPERRVTNSDGVGDVFVWGSNETGVLGLTTAFGHAATTVVYVGSPPFCLSAMADFAITI